MSNDLTIKPTNTKPAFTPRATGLAAKMAAAKAAGSAKEEDIIISPLQMKHRIGIVFDDSGSMSPQMISDAHKGIEEFLRACEKDQTAVTVYPMNAAPLELSSNLPALALLVKSIHASGGTPLVQTALKMFSNYNLTRGIVFSDGRPNNVSDSTYNQLIKAGKPIDTVYICNGSVDEYAVQFMKKLAADTDGIYLQFDSTKSNFATAFKYLSSGLRYLLADRSFVDKLEGR